MRFMDSERFLRLRRGFKGATFVIRLLFRFSTLRFVEYGLPRGARSSMKLSPRLSVVREERP
jgi:hypothetical protein